jgi:succinoglycan biosynthesis transport protein ExoP
MRPSGAENLRAAFLRSLPVIAICILLGIVAVNVIRQLQGPRYAASAQVFLSSTDLGAVLTGTQPQFTDPTREAANAVTLANSSELYERAATATGGELGSGDELNAATSVSSGSNTDVLTFTATADTPQSAVDIANAVAASYISWRGDISGAAIDQAITQVEQRLAQSPPNSASLNDQLDKLEVLKTLNSSNATLIEKANSASKTSPNIARDSLLGFAIGLVIALIVSVAREGLTTKVRSEGEVEDLLGVPVLVSIHTLPRRTQLVTVGKHAVRYSEAYGLLAASLMQVVGRSGPKIIAVTSASDSEGKTTTASNLAVALANRGSRVILADFDLRRPSVSRVFRIPSDSPGIMDAISGGGDSIESTMWTISLNGSANVAPTAATAVRGAPVSRNGKKGSLRVLPAGKPTQNGSMVQSPRVPALLESVSSDADVVILDTPPALASVEMLELSRDVPAVLIVVRQGRATHRSLRLLRKQAQSWGAVVVGAVMTDTRGEDPYHYGYGR